MKNVSLPYNQKFYINGTGLSGIQSMEGSYGVTEQNVNFIGFGYVTGLKLRADATPDNLEIAFKPSKQSLQAQSLKRQLDGLKEKQGAKEEEEEEEEGAAAAEEAVDEKAVAA